jgi:NADPH-dependent ferric siderophore reductase
VKRYEALVAAREQVAPHLVRVLLDVPGFVSTGIPDEWVGLAVSGKYRPRYYTVLHHDGPVVDEPADAVPSAGDPARGGPSADGGSADGQPRGDGPSGDGGAGRVTRLALDIALHSAGLVTEWAARDRIVGQTVTITAPKGSFGPPAGAEWLLLAGDLTAMPAMARIARETDLPTRIWAEVPDRLPGYLPAGAEASWANAGPESRLAEIVESIERPDGQGYLWAAGESGQIRAIRKHMLRVHKVPGQWYNTMGYWRAGAGRRPAS